MKRTRRFSNIFREKYYYRNDNSLALSNIQSANWFVSRQINFYPFPACLFLFAFLFNFIFFNCFGTIITFYGFYMYNVVLIERQWLPSLVRVIYPISSYILFISFILKYHSFCFMEFHCVRFVFCSSFSDGWVFGLHGMRIQN